MKGYVRGVCLQHVGIKTISDLVKIWNEKEKTQVTTPEIVAGSAPNLHTWRCSVLQRVIDPESGEQSFVPRDEVLILRQDYLVYSQLTEVRDLPFFWVFCRSKARHRALIKCILASLQPTKAAFVQTRVDYLYDLMMQKEGEAERMSLTKLIAKLDIDTQIATIWLNGREREDIRSSHVFREAFSKFKFTPATLGIRFEESSVGDAPSFVNMFLDAFGNFTIYVREDVAFTLALTDLIAYMMRLDLLRVSLVDPFEREASFERKVLG